MNITLNPAFVAYRDEAKAAFVAAGMEWNADNAQSVVRCWNNGVTIEALLGSFVLNMPLDREGRCPCVTCESDRTAADTMLRLREQGAL